ncbi:MAG TPA: helix-turn-helix transcriptional regulator [Polyangiaceae bacterium]
MGGKRIAVRRALERRCAPEPPALGLPPALRASELRVGDEAYVVLSYSLAEPSVPTSLSKAEREVASALVEGESYAQIATRRGTASRTVANQVASIFRKLGVSSRLELAVRLQGASPET